MKKILIMLMVGLTMTAFSQYVVGDNVTDISWEDSKDGSIISESIQSFVDNKDVLLITWGYLG
ncbi:MAG: hypothetical protein PF574_05555 [Candidatus Delongbacteria bacterium]|jgi:predicted transcriptional regulator|nr:hypothetical protein [Candidatus Delongbacteria bacterium]